jgi:hypothetical protein
LFPQPSGAVPHFKLPQATGCDFGTHAHVPGLPLHESPEGHAPLFVPHEIWPEQPSDTFPQFEVPQAADCVLGTQAQVPGPPLAPLQE